MAARLHVSAQAPIARRKLAFPSATLLMHKHGLKPEAIGEGTGLHGTLTKGDVLAHLAAPRAPVAAVPPSGPLLTGAHLGHVFARKLVALNRLESLTSSPEALENLIVMAAARALSSFPEFGSGEGQLSLTVLSGAGVLGAARLSTADLASVSHIEAIRRAVSTTASDAAPSAFSVTLLGGLPVVEAGHVLQPTQRAALAVGKLRSDFIAQYIDLDATDGASAAPQQSAVLVAPLSLTVDSRVAGHERAADFLAAVDRLCQDPQRLLV